MTPELLLKMQELRDEEIKKRQTFYGLTIQVNLIAQEFYDRGFEDAVKLLMENKNLMEKQ